ncbi:MAG: choice-of-anchor L domain-containing protein [Lachnospiraceae bacterium]|nr:choice-of-anchor L domain-containing protein [Lachnospiraceae bacterium]
MKKRFRGILLAVMALVFAFTFFPLKAAAEPSVLTSASDWAAGLYPSDAGITFDNVIGGGSMYSGVTYMVNGNSTDDTLLLTTTSGLSSGNNMAGASVGNILSGLSGYGFGGHLSYVEVETTVPSKKLTFNYAFCSSEFDQSEEYNDSFALLYSIKLPDSESWSEYTNVAVIPDVGAVSIKNLKYAEKWTSNGSLSGSSADGINDFAGKGYTEFFEAKIEDLVPGSKIRVLFAICDITDEEYDSAVVIEAGSFKFTKALADYDNEKLYNLDPGETYTITFSDSSTLDVVADANGVIPMEFSVAGKDYSLLGETVTIAVADDPTAIPQTLTLAERPDSPEAPDGPDEDPARKPDDITSPDVEPDMTTLTVINPVEGQEYSIDNGMTWIRDSGSGEVAFTDLTPNTEYEIITRIAATQNAPASLPSDPVKVKTLPQPETYSIFTADYNAPYDGAAHSAEITVSDTERAQILYSTAADAEYTSELPMFTDVGEYTVYYSAIHPDYYPAYGTVQVTITPREVTVSGITAKDREFEADNRSVDLILDKVVFDNIVSGDKLTIEVTGEMDDDKVGQDKNVALTYGALDGAAMKNYKLAEQGNQMTTTVNISLVNDKGPQTGDNSHMSLYIVLAIISAIVLIGTAVYSKKRKSVR